MNDWYCKLLDREFGPLTLDELQKMVHERRLVGTDLVRRGTSGPWRAVADTTLSHGVHSTAPVTRPPQGARQAPPIVNELPTEAAGRPPTADAPPSYPKDTSDPARRREGQMWWLAVTGSATGPFAAALLRAQLADGVLDARALVCPVGGKDWRAIEEWPELAGETKAPLIDLNQRRMKTVNSKAVEEEYSREQAEKEVAEIAGKHTGRGMRAFAFLAMLLVIYYARSCSMPPEVRELKELMSGKKKAAAAWSQTLRGDTRGDEHLLLRQQ